MNGIGFIGAGNMGYAMIQGMIKSNKNTSLYYTDASEDRMKWIEQQLGIPYEKNNHALIQKSKYIILAIKPQYYLEVLEEIKSKLEEDQILISIAPGITIDKIKEVMATNNRVVRVMPNTPALVGEGMSVIAFSNDPYEEKEKTCISNIFESFGEVEVVHERLMNAIVPISGSSPAYVYMMIEAMADAGVLQGLPRELAYKLAAQSVSGAAKMVLDTKSHPGELKDAVCSPGGTTIEAVTVLEKNKFRSAIIEAMNSCYDKTVKLGSK